MEEARVIITQIHTHTHTHNVRMDEWKSVCLLLKTEVNKYLPTYTDIALCIQFIIVIYMYAAIVA